MMYSQSRAVGSPYRRAAHDGVPLGTAAESDGLRRSRSRATASRVTLLVLPRHREKAGAPPAPRKRAVCRPCVRCAARVTPSRCSCSRRSGRRRQPRAARQRSAQRPALAARTKARSSCSSPPAAVARAAVARRGRFRRTPQPRLRLPPPRSPTSLSWSPSSPPSRPLRLPGPPRLRPRRPSAVARHRLWESSLPGDPWTTLASSRCSSRRRQGRCRALRPRRRRGR